MRQNLDRKTLITDIFNLNQHSFNRISMTFKPIDTHTIARIKNLAQIKFATYIRMFQLRGEALATNLIRTTSASQNCAMALRCHCANKDTFPIHTMSDCVLREEPQKRRVYLPPPPLSLPAPHRRTQHPLYICVF